MKIITTVIILAVMALVLSFGSVFANDEGLPAERVIAAIQTAVAATPGLIEDVEIEREGGRLIVEVEIIGADGRETEVKVDPEKNEVIR